MPSSAKPSGPAPIQDILLKNESVPLKTEGLPQPPQDFCAVIEKIKAIQAREVATPGFNPKSKTLLLTHGARTRRAVLWFHGYTDTPRQFKKLAELCYEKGYNVLVPCVPHHGFKDRLSGEMSNLNSKELIRFTEEMVDLMHGLGDEISVAGISMGGVMAAWAAQERADVKTAILIAPFFGARIIPAGLTKIAAYGSQFLPDIKQWWDPVRKEKMIGSETGYMKNSTHSLGQILRMGFQIFSAARFKPPAAESIWMIINDGDESVNNGLNQRLVTLWEKSNAKNVQSFHFPAELDIPHDCINIEQPKSRTKLVYAELMKRMG